MAPPFHSFYLHFSRHFLSEIMLFLYPLFYSSCHSLSQWCTIGLLLQGRKGKKKSPIQIVEPLYVQVSDQHGCTLKCLHCRLDAEALSPHQQSVSLSLEDVKGCRITPTGCWQKQQLDLTKKKRKYSNWPAKIIGIKAEGGCSRQGCYQSAQVSPEMLQNADSLKFAWASPGLAPSSWMLIVKQLADAKGNEKSSKTPAVNLHELTTVSHLPPNMPS